MAIDAPIGSRAQDGLGRASFANTIAAAVRALDASQGAVVALFGPWGVGKTSLLNMIREALAEDPPLIGAEFNPWMFSGAEQLVVRFFEEIAKQLGQKPGRLKGVANQLLAYGEAVAPLHFIPVAGPWIGRTAAVAKAARALRHEQASASQVGDHGIYFIHLKQEDTDQPYYRLINSEGRFLAKDGDLVASNDLDTWVQGLEELTLEELKLQVVAEAEVP